MTDMLGQEILERQKASMYTSKASVSRQWVSGGSLTADMAAELKPHGVHAVTLYPGAGVTEVTAFPGGETPVFTGRAVGALLNKASKETLDRYSGKVIQTAELAANYSFTDAGGAMPDGPFSGIEAGKRCREAMSQPIFQYNLDGELPDPMETNNTEIAGLFPGA